MTIEKKHFAAVEFKEFDDDDLSFVAYASKETVDRDGELVKSSAWDLEDFRKNPVVMLAHDYSKLPIGKSLWEKMTPDGLKFKPKFANTTTGREVYQLYKEGILNAFSVGFIPVEWEDGKKSGSKAHRVYTKAKLLEVSCVAVPSCPDALVERVAKGMIKDGSLKKAFDEIVPKEMVDTFLAKLDKGSDDETPVVETEEVDVVETAIEKAGRELSNKNVSLLKSIASKLGEAAEAIESMVGGNESEQEEKTVVGDGTVDMDVDGTTAKQVDDAITVDDVKSIMLKGFSELSAGVAGSVLSKDDIKSIIKDEINRAKGRIG